MQTDYLGFDTDRRFDLIIMIMCDFCALSPEQRALLLGTVRSLLAAKGKVLLDKYTIVERDRVRRIFNWLRCFTPAGLERESADCGLRVVERWGDVAGGPYLPAATEFAIVAERCTDG